jgi:hypothetical protein
MGDCACFGIAGMSDIPFNNLKTQPVLITLSQVYATLAPSPEIDPKMIKRSQLNAHDHAWAEAKDDTSDADEDGKASGMAAKYTQKIMVHHHHSSL